MITDGSPNRPTTPLEESGDPVVCIGPATWLPSSGEREMHHAINVSADPELNSDSRCSQARALEMFVKYSFVRCAGLPPVRNDTRKR